jgi:hypothetical protein
VDVPSFGAIVQDDEERKRPSSEKRRHGPRIAKAAYPPIICD